MEIGSSILGITAFAIFLIVYLNYVKIADLKEDVKMISRKYLLEMETVGYLTPESAASFRQSLAELGVTDIDIDVTNTTVSSVGYGEAIYLQATYNIPAQALNLSGGDMLGFFFENISVPGKIRMTSTAKH